MITRIAPMICVAAILASCSTAGNDEVSLETEYQTLELAAAGNIQCAWENQTRCAHMIDRRSTFARFFAPDTLGNLQEAKKNKGRRVTTRFIVEAAAEIKQCRRVEIRSIPIVRDVQIAGKPYRVEGTAPLSPNSSCFLIPDQENS